MSEALRGRRSPRRLFVATSRDAQADATVTAAQAVGVPVERVERDFFDAHLPGANHQGIALLASAYPYVGLDEILARSGTVLVLDHLQDPQNFGTLIRAAEAANVSGVVIPHDRAVDVRPSVVNASAGAVEHVSVAQVANLVRGLEQLKQRGWWVAGLASGAGAVDLYRATLPSPIALVVGSEGKGIGQRVRANCDLIVEIPMAGRIESLNASTAGAIALFEIVRQSRSRSAAP